MSGPRTRMSFWSEGAMPTVRYGFTVTVGGLVAMLIKGVDAARLTSIANRCAEVVANVVGTTSGPAGSKITLIACVVTALPAESTTFAFTGTPPTMTVMTAFV